MFNKLLCQSELATIPLLIYLYGRLLKNLDIGGCLYLNLNKYCIYKPSIQLLYFIFTLFDEVSILENKLMTSHFGYIKFSNYKYYINDVSNMDNIIEEYIVKDPYLGQNTIIKSEDLLYCDKFPQNKRKPNINFVIKSIMKNSVNHIFTQFMFEAYNDKNKQIKEQILKIELLEKNMNIDMIISNNISKSIDLCNTLNIEINDIYNNFKVANYKNIIKSYFPKDNNANLDKIELAIDSIYSITKPDITEIISKLIKKEMSSVNYIIDGTSNIGTTAIVLSYYFTYIYAVEIGDITFNKLKNNINVYKLNNVLPILDDIIKFMNDDTKLKKINFNKDTYCLFLDPPWKGVFYKTENQVDLELSNINILDFIKQINVKYICLKVPFNYNFAKLYKYFYNIVIHRLSGFYVIFIKK